MSDLEAFVQEHAASLLNTAFLIVWDQQDAEDVVQEALTTVARRWDRVKAMDAPLAYARKVVVNQSLRAKRRRGRHPAEQLDPRHDLELATGADGAGDHALALDRYLDLYSALARLPLDQRATVTLRYFDGLSEAEIASTMGCAPGTVKSRCARALVQLRAEIETPDEVGNHGVLR